MSTEMQTTYVDHDAISNTVRQFCTQRLYELERGLRPLVDGSFGDILPGHLQGYLACLKELARLYQADKPPRDIENMIPASKVQELLARMEEQHEARVSEAVAAAEARVRMELESGRRAGIEAAKETVLSKLQMLDQRQSS